MKAIQHIAYETGAVYLNLERQITVDAINAMEVINDE